ncbi:MAG: hypothetical protein WC139_07030 [Candidatus Kapaibacterium sp.]
MYRQEKIVKTIITALETISVANGYANNVDEVTHFIGGVIPEPGKIILEVRDTDEQTLSGEDHIINNAEDELMLHVFGGVVSEDITAVVANKAARLALTTLTSVVFQMDNGLIYSLKSGGVPTVEADWNLFDVYTTLMSLISDVRKCFGNNYSTWLTTFGFFKAEYLSTTKNIVQDKKRIGEFESIYKITFITDQFLDGETVYA